MERQEGTQGKMEEKGLKRWEKKCRKERVKSGGNISCCPSTLLLQVSDEFLLFCFLDAHSVSNPSVFLSGGLPSIPVWIEGIGGEGKKKHISVYIYLKMDCQCLNHTREKERKKRSLCW